MENLPNKVYEESDLLLYCQLVRLLADRRVNNDDLNRSKKIYEDKKTFTGVIKNFTHKIERDFNDYEARFVRINENIETIEAVFPKIKDDDQAKKAMSELFKDDKYDLVKLLFASSVILDDEFKYIHKDEGLRDVSELLYGNRFELLQIRDKLEENFNKISPKSLSTIQKGLLFGAAVASLVGVVCLPVLLVGGTTAAAATTTGALAAAGFADMQIGAGVITASSIALGALMTGAVYGSMKLYNDQQIKNSFKDLTADEEALYLAIQCTYIQNMRDKLGTEEFKAQLDEILRSANNLKSDVDYYLYVENEDKETNVSKIKAFHAFDKRLMKILGI